ncbi:MAG: MFS transporter [Pseudomonadota bacterium]|nr:MFS transporter [Pseudomonadota bacterium]
MSKPLPVRSILAYGSLNLPVGTIGLPVAIYLAPLYAGQLDLSLGLIGVAFLLARLSDFITDPLVGVLSDRWRPKIGRRRIWLILGTIVMMAGVFLLFRPQPGANIIYFLGAVSLVYFGYTLLLVPYAAWGAELSGDYNTRTRITSSARFFDICGLIISTLIPAYVLSRDGANSADVMYELSTFILIALPIAAAIVFFAVPEPPPPPRKAPFSIKAAARVLTQNGPFGRIAVILLIATIGEVFRQTITLFFARDVVGVTNIGAVYFYYFIAALVMVPFWLWLAQKIQKHRALTLAFIIIAVTNAAMFLLGEGDDLAFIALFVIKGACYGPVLMLPPAMIADASDIDTLKSQDRQQGLFYAMAAMVQKIGFALGASLPLVILGIFEYNSDGETDPEKLLPLSLCYSIIPGVLVMIAAWLTIRYSLTAERHKEIRDQIDAQTIGLEAPAG